MFNQAQYFLNEVNYDLDELGGIINEALQKLFYLGVKDIPKDFPIQITHPDLQGDFWKHIEFDYRVGYFSNLVEHSEKTFFYFTQKKEGKDYAYEVTFPSSWFDKDKDSIENELYKAYEKIEDTRA